MLKKWDKLASFDALTAVFAAIGLIFVVLTFFFVDLPNFKLEEKKVEEEKLKSKADSEEKKLEEEKQQLLRKIKIDSFKEKYDQILTQKNNLKDQHYAFIKGRVDAFPTWEQFMDVHLSTEPFIAAQDFLDKASREFEQYQHFVNRYQIAVGQCETIQESHPYASFPELYKDIAPILNVNNHHNLSSYQQADELLKITDSMCEKMSIISPYLGFTPESNTFVIPVLLSELSANSLPLSQMKRESLVIANKRLKSIHPNKPTLKKEALARLKQNNCLNRSAEKNITHIDDYLSRADALCILEGDIIIWTFG